ncbi:MAG: hypothetical protein K9N34_07305 [Candidatus Marinimicrobia bacterium]|nr:hypothetical protein [Candidatus Neomarinimicrobiota bacterium]MCF7840845.1 hypothetical protein [Candidatus Neomarinimicrobiota bacterium]MCF7902751.1 hypothetical protein [Candidatus Neomarinimicrobiota bacterium]
MLKPSYLSRTVLGIFFLTVPVLAQLWEVTATSDGDSRLNRNIRLVAVEDTLLWVQSTDYIGNRESPILAVQRHSNRWAIPIEHIVGINRVYLRTERPEAVGALMGFFTAIPVSAIIAGNPGGTDPGISGLISEVFYNNFWVFLITTPIGAWLGHASSPEDSESGMYDLTDYSLGEKRLFIEKLIEEI